MVPNIDDKHDEAGEEYESYMLYPVERWSDERAKLIAKAIKKNWKKIQGIIDSYSDDIVIQVVATLIMASGGTFPRGFRPKAIAAGNNDEWAAEGGERRARIQEYIKAVNEYKSGTRIVLTSEGLFSKMEKLLN